MAKTTAKFDSESENCSGSEAPGKRIARPPKPIKLPPPLYIAYVKELAQTNSTTAGSSTTGVGSAILLQIGDCLERASHARTVEAEAKQALHLASRLMGQYNVSQADVLSHEPPATQRQYAGQSVVSIKRADGDRSKAMKHQSYIDGLCRTMERLFDCKSYSTTSLLALELTFYGIAENTAAAAMAFKMVYNLVSEWAWPHKGIGCRNSYCLGVSDELSRMASKEKAVEEAEAKIAEREEITAKNREVDKLSGKVLPAPLAEACKSFVIPEPAYASNNVDDDPHLGRCNASGVPWSDWVTDTLDDIANTELPEDASESSIQADVKVEDESDRRPSENTDTEMGKSINSKHRSSRDPPRLHSQAPLGYPVLSLLPKRDPAKMEPIHGMLSAPAMFLSPQWASHMQLVIFRAIATKLADDYVEEKGIKINHRSTRRTVIHSRAAYSQGVKDSKKIDVHRSKVKE